MAGRNAVVGGGVVDVIGVLIREIEEVALATIGVAAAVVVSDTNAVVSVTNDVVSDASAVESVAMLSDPVVSVTGSLSWRLTKHLG